MRTSLAVGLAVVGGLGSFAAFDRQPRWAQTVPAEIVSGRRVYAAECAGCHGAALEGQPRWWEPGADGLLPAPPHDASGHTWQHSDRSLHELIAHSVASVAPEGYRTAMPAYAGRLSDAEIDGVIAYIKSTWPVGVRAYQATLNPGGPSLATLRGNWSFPPTCRAPDLPRG